MTPFIPYGEPSAHENSMGIPKNEKDFRPLRDMEDKPPVFSPEQARWFGRNLRMPSLQPISPDGPLVVEPTPKRRGAKVMDEAAEIINGERNEHYGEPEDNFRNIAEMWNAYLRPRYGFDKLDAYDVAMLMVLMKVARNGHYRKLDNLVDIVGYTAHAGDIDD